MADGFLTAQPALAEFAAATRIGKPDGPPGVAVALRGDMRLASVIARRAALPALTARVQTLFGISLPVGPRRSVAAGLAILGTGPGRFLFVRQGGGEDFAAGLERAFEGIVSVSDHSDAYAVFELHGICAGKLLAKGVAIDLHPNAFGTGDAAVTSIAHIGAILWQIDPAPRYGIAVFRSFAGSFWHWLVGSAKEFGIEMMPYDA